MAKMMSSTSGKPSPSIAQQPPSPPPQLAPSSLPVRAIPGSYGWPLIGAISDRLDYFWFQGPETFFRKRMEKYKSSVFRTNIPPSFPLFVGVNPNVVAVLDVKSFSHLFDMEIVEKANVLVGDYMPSTNFTGGLRVCPYLDTSEPMHSQMKNYALDILKRSSSIWVPTMVSKMDIMWQSIESDISKSGSASYLLPLQKFLFTFLTKCLIGADTSASSEIAESGHTMIDKWLALQLLPTVKIGILQPLEEIFLHSFAYPFWLVEKDYKKLVEFVKKEGKEAIERGVNEFKLTEDEAVHNLLFTLGFNAFGGFSVYFPSIFTTLGDDEKNKGLQEKLRNEVRDKCGKDFSNLSFESIKELELVQSFVYETLRLNPPVPSQYARARKDFNLVTHESVFEIKKGELLCGYQPLVMRDPKVFDDPENFKFDRFTQEKGRDLLNYLYWSNGPQTGSPDVSNKQCAAKEIVTLTATLFLAYMFQRYDSVTISSGSISAVVKAQ